MRKKIEFFAVAFLLLMVCQSASAQLCKGSLGDPIVNISFGAGNNPGAPLAAATTAYQYVNYDCPNDGFYTIRNKTNNCFNNGFHTLNTDHTGDPNGYFMLINASFAPSAFYLDTVKGLCGNTTYEFAAWILNILGPQSICGNNSILPNLTFNIENKDGTVIQKYNTGNINTTNSPVWKQYGFFFTTPPNSTDIVLRLFNNAPGGCGNDIALDDITFRACGPQLMPAIKGYNGTIAPVCKGVNKVFDFTCAVSPGFTNPHFQWQQINALGVWVDLPGDTLTSLTKTFISAAAIANYSFRISAVEEGNQGSIQCRVFSDPLVIQVRDNPVTNAGSNSPVCEGATLLLNAGGGTTYSWTYSGNPIASANPATITPVKQEQAGKYFVAITDSNGCKSNDSTTVVVNPKPKAATSFNAATICSGDSVQLNSSGGTSFAWLPETALSFANIASPIASPQTTTSYTVSVANPIGCMDTASIVITVNEKPTANAGPDKTIITGNSLLLAATATGGSLTYHWSPATAIDDTTVLQPRVNPASTINYILTVVSTIGCGTAVDSMKVFVYNGLLIPKAFSPNGDGLNDTWNLPALNAFPNYELSVFDRYGKLVFQSKNTTQPWDGRYKGEALNPGAYVYLIDLKQAPGILKGTVSIIR